MRAQITLTSLVMSIILSGCANLKFLPLKGAAVAINAKQKVIFSHQNKKMWSCIMERHYFLGIFCIIVGAVCLPSQVLAHVSKKSPDPKFRSVYRYADNLFSGRDVYGVKVSCKSEINSTYDGISLERCRYKQGKLFADVVLSNPDAHQLAKWSLFTCEGLGDFGNNKFESKCAKKILNKIKKESGGHFPVAGVIIRHNKFYVYRDGINVNVADIENGGEKQLTDDEMNKAIVAPVIGWDERVSDALIGSTYDQYVRFGRSTNLEGKLIVDSALTFPEFIGKSYREALGASYNVFFNSWACGNLKYIGSKMSCVDVSKAIGSAARNKP